MAGRFEYVDDTAAATTAPRFEYVVAPEPTFKERMLRRETSDLSSNLRRGVKDAWDTLALGPAWLHDKVTGVDPEQGEFGRLKAMSKADEEQWSRENEGEILPHVQRLLGNAIPATRATSLLGRGFVAAGMPRLGSAIGSAGMSAGGPAGVSLASRAADVGLRSGGGVVNGYVTAGLADPDAANTGAVIGGAIPPALQTLKAGTQGVLSAVRSRGDAGLAREIAGLGGAESLDDVARMRDALRQQGPRLIPGAEPTVPQILLTPGTSQLQRSVKAVDPTLLAEREAAQHAARFGALNRIAPVSGTVQQAATDAGESIASVAIPARQRDAQRVSQLFDSIDPQQARIELPLSQMQAAQTRFTGPGTFGKGGEVVERAMQTATDIGTDPITRIDPRAVPFDQLQGLRSSIGEAVTQARVQGNNQAAAALSQMKKAIDDKVAAVAAGNARPGEVFTPQAVDTWSQALNAHRAKKLRFDTGPQASMFRLGNDGMPQIQGAEIPGKFFGASRSQVENAQAFVRLAQNDQGLMSDLRRYAITDAANQVDRFGNLTSAKFNKWLDARSGATGVIFDGQQRAILKEIADSLRRADMAESLGRSTGSDTVQKAANVMRLGLADNGAVNLLAGRIPGGKALVGLLGDAGRNAKAEKVGGLLADPERMAGLLDVFIATQQPMQTGLLGSAVSPAIHRGAPLLLTNQ